MSSKDIIMICSMVGCTDAEALRYLNEANGDVLLAICNHTPCPEITGSKYIPPPPKINDGLTDEVRSKIQEARKVSEAFSASFRNDLRGAREQKDDEAVTVVQEEQNRPAEQPAESVGQIDVGEYS